MDLMQSSPSTGRPPPTPPLNRKYLRAFHDYQPAQPTLSGSTGGVSVTVSLNEGDIILVHLTHSNGWADGTNVRTGARGWIPTNYCQVYDHPFIRSLLHAITALWDYLGSRGVSTVNVDERKDYVQGLIAGVRRLLEHCDCLHRDDSLIQKHMGLRQTRKSLLADLASLIKYRQAIHNADSADSVGNVDWETVDEYMSKAFKIACRAVRFLDLWKQGASPKRLQPEAYSYDGSTGPSRSPTALASPLSEQFTLHDAGDAVGGAENRSDRTVDDSTHDWTTESRARVRDVRLNRHSTLGIPTESLSRDVSPRPSPVHQHSSPQLTSRPTSFIGLGIAINEPISSDLASERLTDTHDKLLSHMGAFIGLHYQSRTSTDITTTTQRSLQTCATLVAIAVKIWEQDPSRSQAVYVSIMLLREKLQNLAVAAHKICRTDRSPEPAVISRPEAGETIVAAATACVRSAGDCTAKVRQLLDQNGDFELSLSEMQGVDLNLDLDTPSSISPVRTSTYDPERLSPNSVQANRPHESNNSSRNLRLVTDRCNNFSLPSFSAEIGGHSYTSVSPVSPTSTAKRNTLPSVQAANAFGSQDGCPKSSWTARAGKPSPGAASTSTRRDSTRNSAGSATTTTSTQATTPDTSLLPAQIDPTLLNSFASIDSMRSSGTTRSEDSSDGEAEILAKSYSHELLFNKENQILGGTLPALVEKLTSQHSPPDSEFVLTFYLTFRLFTTAVELARALIDRYQYVGESKTEAMPARLRIYNFFKGWLESHWLSNPDSEALGLIRVFAITQLARHLPAIGRRLAALVEKASKKNITSTSNQIISPIGKTSTSLGTQYEKEAVPSVTINKGQLSLLRNVLLGAATCGITDFDALEIARQLTIIESSIFCAIEPSELLALDWNKDATTAVNIGAMAKFSTDLANLVADTILSTEEVKKRALVLKQWIKIGKRCIDLNNYDSLMALVCALSSSTIVRLRHTWDLVPQKSKAYLEEMKSIVDISRNYAVLRQRLQTPEAPCLPFVGIYLTDLTFVDAGNQDTRIMPGVDGAVESTVIINFDKHMRTARIISQLQRYQVPYRLRPVCELQEWLEAQTSRVHASEDCSMQSFWRRSLALEPRATDHGDDAGGGGGRQGASGTGANMGMAGFRPKHRTNKSGLGMPTLKQKSSKNDLGAHPMPRAEKFGLLGTLGFKD